MLLDCKNTVKIAILPKAILKKKNKAGSTTIPELRKYYKTIVVKTMWYWYKYRLWANGTEQTTQK